MSSEIDEALAVVGAHTTAYRAMLETLTQAQKRCTELVEENRKLKFLIYHAEVGSLFFHVPTGEPYSVFTKTNCGVVSMRREDGKVKLTLKVTELGDPTKWRPASL